MKFLPTDSFAQRGRALEDKFFHERDQELLHGLRNELATMEEEHKLGHVSGIVEEKVLLDLVKAGVTGESLLAVRLIPMIVVAWSDHIITPEERAAILKAAVEDQIAPETAAYKLITSWLEVRPPQAVVNAWHEYVRELVKISPPDAVKTLRDRTCRLCNRVAHASSSLLSFGKISKAKQKIIDEFLETWETPRDEPA